jgi:hypothetical protein
MVVDRRRGLVFLSGTRISLSRSFSASRCRSSICIGTHAGKRAADVVLLRQPFRLLSVCAAVRNRLAGDAGKCSGGIPAGSGRTISCSIGTRHVSPCANARTTGPADLVLLRRSAGLLSHGAGVPVWLAANTGKRSTRCSALVSGRPIHQRPTAIERLEKAQAFRASAVARLDQFLAVPKPLYAALSPEQQKVADVVLNRRGQSMEKPSMHGRGGFGRG